MKRAECFKLVTSLRGYLLCLIEIHGNMTVFKQLLLAWQ